MTDNELRAYLAGIMDADGYFCIRRKTQTFHSSGSQHQTIFSESVGLNQVTDAVISILRARYGGNVMCYAAKTPRSRPIFRWRLENRKACAVARDLMDFLIIKRRDAEILLELQAHKSLPHSETRTAIGTKTLRHWTGITVTTRKFALSPEAIAYRESLWHEMRALHDVKDRQTMLFRVAK